MEKVSSVKDRVGERIGKLVVIERAANKIEVAKSGKKSVRACWLCKCDCGNEIVASGHNLSKALSNPNSTAGTRSCGCLMGKGGLKHGRSTTNSYGAWNNIIQRCTNPNSTAYASYGGRGIKVCDEWLTFEGFIKEMGERQEGMTLERINNELGYFKDNCKWATRRQQANNRRSNVKLEYMGKIMSIADWARKVGLSKGTLTSRIKHGWTVERALTEPNLRN
jgi:hypothetical protein